jgi:hypothetical protein
MQKTSRFIRRNAVDRMFVILPVLLLIALLARGITGYFFPVNADKCAAEISFVIRAVDGETKNRLENVNPAYNFSIAGKELLCGAQITDITPTKEVVSDGEGNFVELPIKDHYDVTFTVSYADGARAKDGAFMIGGVRRLAVGESMNLTDGHAEYLVDFIKVRILE